jgi:hypothetical protein
MPAVCGGSSLRRAEILQHQCQGFVQLQPVSGGVCEEESALSNKESSLDSSAARRWISFLISFVRLSLSCARLFHSCARLFPSCSLICASTVGCQFNLANQCRHGGKEERNSDLLINSEVEESEENDMAVGGEKGDQNNQHARRQGDPARRIQRRRVVSRSCVNGLCCEGREINRASR